MAYKAPKTVANHPAVKECLCGEAEGSDYVHYVELRDGWCFDNGRAEGCSSLFYNKVSEFHVANPIKRGGVA